VNLSSFAANILKLVMPNTARGVVSVNYACCGVVTFSLVCDKLVIYCKLLPCL